MKVCIAEKPSVAKDLAEVLGAKSRKDGYFEGNGYQVTWTFGHLCTLKAPDDYSKHWKQWNLLFLPMIPPRFGIKIINDSGVQKQFDTIKELVSACEEVINCGDAGIEGEVIQRWVLTKAGFTGELKRLWISSLTEEAIKEGFENLKNGYDYDPLYAAGNARAIGDWLLGMNASRLYTLKYANNKGVLSVGRVQTPTLALIVRRHLEIEHFVPEDYWEIKTLYRGVTFNSTKGKFKVKEEAEKYAEEIKISEFSIKDFTRKKGKEAPPKLFDLTALQVECNKKFNFSAEDTLKYIQNLYEKKLVTYPRVDTTFLPTDMYPKVPNILKGMKPYEEFTSTILKGKIPKSKKVFDDSKITDHHAIVPTGVNPSSLILQEKQVYDTIARRFLAALYPDCIVSNTTVMGEAANLEFKATGKVILEDGWRALYPKKSGSDDKEEQFMPEFEKGETGPHEPDLLEKQTQPPKQYTEATLLRAMETAGKQVDDEELRDLMKENGIGRPSTRANIIETLFRRRYVQRVRKNLVPTKTGIQLIGTIKNELLKSVELTGQWERKLRLIERSEYDPKEFLEEMKEMITGLVTEVKSETAESIEIVDEKKEEEKKKAEKAEKKKAKATSSIDDLTCPKCGKGKILKGGNAYGCSGFKEGCKFVIPFSFMEKKLTEKQIIALINKGKTPKIKGLVLDGNKVEGNLVLNEEKQISYQEATPAKKKADAPPAEVNNKLICPKCGKGELLRGKSAYGCSRFKEDCKFVIRFEELQTKFGTDILSPEHISKL